MGKEQLKYSKNLSKIKLTSHSFTCHLCLQECSTLYNLQQHVQTHDIATSSDSLTENALSLNVRSIPNSEREFNVVKDNQETLFQVDISTMIEEEQEEALGENISSLRERIFNMASSTINSNEESDLPTLAFEDCQSLLDFSAASGEWNQSVPPFFPFQNLQTLVLQAFVDGDNSMISVSMLTKVIYIINLLFELKKRADETKADFKLSKVGTLLNYQHNKFNKVSLFLTTVKKVTIKATSNLGSGITGQVKTVDCHFNLPSDHLRLLLANPQKASYLSALPDYTENQCLSVQQGEKWRRNPLFQHPFVLTNGKDFWIGDVAMLYSGQSILIERFYMKDMLALFDRYLVEQDSDSEGHALHKVQSSPVTYKINHPKNWSSSGEASLNPTHHGLLFKSHPMKKPMFNSANQFIRFQKAIITPLAIFSDNTSGNLTKTHEMYDSVLVNFSVMSYSMKNRHKNNFFVTAVSQQARFKLTHLMPVLATDLKTLENGVDMYSSTYDETVTVCAPLLFITADNARHAELVGLKHSTSNFSCRKCYYRNLSRFGFDDFDSEYLVCDCQHRMKEHYKIAATDPTRKEKAIPGILPNADNLYLKTEKPTNKALILADLRYSHTGTDDLLCLQSFDPALDTPVEILHTVALEVYKYLVNHLFKEVLKGNTASQVKLSDLLEQEKGSRDFTRTFRKKIRHSGSYFDKEFKILAQVLPPILNTEFTNNTKVSMIAKPFTELDILSSLLFIREVDSDFDQYLNNVNNTAHCLVKSLYEYDIYANTKFSLTLKMHLLLHLKEDIKRFGCALHFETEKGEQFNKFIQTHLVYSNRRADNRDLTFKFGKQDMLRHCCE
ncbi:C2H2-type zinc finger transcription factor [Phycomyces blakesleeanus]|uniref:C2H2-type zinc finger transcription factor n=2 Tax=Phycomyces blakesleeanus TaxID=4837 RepID=A0A163AKD1_PHYB8|nr:C2H2-type zinc finger transcription factor [Phycomyces blakesleeanus NRRL 1555(-)]OAD74091.1 C2H2-type zinc finger transcription factor [Phycomyces blakesleeanus NRRL 1555(-)]|eukprot:XP_018292131.1 C2H2-type zinc finger transcription factor [Phycomyces blakesleeanus NRRL 1555(-)]